jgi:hypothetical protein
MWIYLVDFKWSWRDYYLVVYWRFPDVWVRDTSVEMSTVTPPHLSDGLFQAFMHQRCTFCGGTNIHLLATEWTVEVEM